MQMRKLSLFTKKVKYIVLIMAFTMFFCTGCDAQEREEKQRELRISGITCMENGKYEEALEEFQSALELSMGKVGEEEIDICFYKAEAHNYYKYCYYYFYTKTCYKVNCIF